jgi:hypothetical protein
MKSSFNVGVTASNLVLWYMRKFFAAGRMVLNLNEMNIMQFITNKIFAVLGCYAVLIGS